MKTRILGAVVGITALLGGLLVASPAQALDGLDFKFVDQGGESRGYVQADVDFRSRTTVVWQDFLVRDVCPGDGRPVRARVGWTNADGTQGVGSWKADTNGCGPDGTNFGDIWHIGSKSVARAWMTVCVYTESGGNEVCANSPGRDNPHV